MPTPRRVSRHLLADSEAMLRLLDELVSAIQEGGDGLDSDSRERSGADASGRELLCFAVPEFIDVLAHLRPHAGAGPSSRLRDDMRRTTADAGAVGAPAGPEPADSSAAPGPGASG